MYARAELQRPILHFGFAGHKVAAAMLGLIALPMMAAPKKPQPALTLSLAALGFPGYSSAFTEVGACMLTLHFVDNEHLLVTYSLRGLLERLADDPKEDDDRAVGAVLVELPTGKVLARTKWRLHDHSTYLFPLGEGRFLLRVRSQLVAIAPLANLAAGDAFRQMPFAQPENQIDGVFVSPDGALVTVESSKPRTKLKFDATGLDTPPEVKPRERIEFVRVAGTGAPGDPVRAIAAGRANAENPVSIPMNGRGYLYSERTRGGSWKVSFEGYDGGSKKLAPLRSSCTPRVQLVSATQ